MSLCWCNMHAFDILDFDCSMKGNKNFSSTSLLLRLFSREQRVTWRMFSSQVREYQSKVHRVAKTSAQTKTKPLVRANLITRRQQTWVLAEKVMHTSFSKGWPFVIWNIHNKIIAAVPRNKLPEVHTQQLLLEEIMLEGFKVPSMYSDFETVPRAKLSYFKAVNTEYILVLNVYRCA
jgi:hypothetical protein